MEKMVLKILLMCALGMNPWMCVGFPVYDYDPSFLREALSASVAKVNAQSLSPYLFRPFRSSVKRVNILEEGNVSMDIEFSIRETMCRKDSGEDPATCDFQAFYMPAAVCRSTVWVSAEKVQNPWVHCHWSSSSESSSSEEMIFRDIQGSTSWRNNNLLGLIPDKPRREQFYERSSEVMRRAFSPGRRGYPNQWRRARINTGFE